MRGHAPTQHAPPREGPQTNAARPTMGGATHQHSTPHHGGGHAPTQYAQPIRGGAHQHSTRPGQVINTTTTAIQPPTTPIQTRRQYGVEDNTEQTKQAAHGAGSNTTTSTTNPNPTPAPRRHTRRQPKPSTTTPRTTTAADRHQQGVPHHEGGHAPAEHAPPRGGPRSKAARTTMRWAAPSTAPTLGVATHRHNRPHSGREARTNTARPTMGGATHQRSKPHQKGGHAPAQHQPRRSKHHSPNRSPTRA